MWGFGYGLSVGVSVMGPTSESATSAVAAREHSRWKWMEGPIGSRDPFVD